MIRFLVNIWNAQRNARDAAWWKLATEQYAEGWTSERKALWALKAENAGLKVDLAAAQSIAAEYQKLAPTRGQGGKFVKKEAQL